MAYTNTQQNYKAEGANQDRMLRRQRNEYE